MVGKGSVRGGEATTRQIQDAAGHPTAMAPLVRRAAKTSWQALYPPVQSGVVVQVVRAAGAGGGEVRRAVKW